MALKLIGTDLSLDWCLKEGYLMMRTDHLNDLKNDLLLFFYIYVEDDDVADDISDEAELLQKLENEHWLFDITEQCIWSLDTLVDRYNELPKRDQLTEFEDIDNPTHYEILSMASDIDAYEGLEWEGLNINYLK